MRRNRLFATRTARRALYVRKRFVVTLSILLSLILLSVALPDNQAQAAPPTPPATALAHEAHERIFPPPAASAPSPMASTQGTSKTFYTVADAEVRESTPTTNYGIALTLGAGYDNYQPGQRDEALIKRALLRFDIPRSLPQGTIVHQAKLQIYTTGVCDAQTSTFRAYGIARDWSEMTATWTNQPTATQEYAAVGIPMAFGWSSLDITPLVQAWVAGTQPDYGLMIKGPEAPPYACAYRDFRSKGGGGFTTAPQLVVDYTLPMPTVSLSQQQVLFIHQCGVDAQTPAPRSIAIQSNSTMLANWSASVVGSAPWLQVSKSSGKVSRIFSDEFELTVSEDATLCPGKFTAQVQVGTAGLGSPKTISVTLQQVVTPHIIYLPTVVRGATGVTQSTVAATATTKRIALLIGVADYQYMDPPAQFSVLRPGGVGFDLLAPRSDVFAFLSVAQASFDSVIVLSEADATKANIDYALDWVDEREDADTEVLIYFSGHGGQITDTSVSAEPDGLDEFLGAFDTGIEPVTTLILDDDLQTRLSRLETRHLAILLDSCNSGGMEVSNSQRAVLAASQEDQVSWETSELEHGVFTFYVLEAMLDPASDTNGDGWLSIQEIEAYIRERIAQYVHNHTMPIAEQNVHLDATSDVKVVRVPPVALTR
jgi:hypothetical protein